MSETVGRAPNKLARSTATARTESGWHPFGPAGQVAEWDGLAWTGLTRAGPDVAAMPRPRRNPAAFLVHPWFLLLILGWLITLGGAVLGTGVRSDHWWWLIIVGIGLAVSLYGFLLVFERHLHFSQLANLPAIAVAGIASGLVGVGLALFFEDTLGGRLHESLQLELWLSGVVEESAKLFAPVLLWLLVAARFRDPRAGLLTVLISGSTFGIVEGIKYIAKDGENVHLVMAMVRTLTEMGHPLWTGVAAAVIWLAAHRAGRLVTVAGLVGWAIAMALHSVHDGLGSWSDHGDSAPKVDYSSTSTIMSYAIGLNLITLAWLIIAFLVLRHAARELTPPDAVAANPRHWRPQIKQWGVARSKHHQ